ncbi:MAG: PEP-CTERM sorting domain-containing protein [Leptolyngbya sp. UWPOB_LEPTO1]|uniref:PEP-CTERM sorting domain-containing protein n=1 Tax=Leptolyngbya sp. UWPOB_LEPTO1 TaxID=2815653 RepID=UPI001AC2DC56|nr:PEP-CTERM sorting domain-containing protein [Leptolyngbya sp. UWPOB_LEPTO1]MBN8559296.1 PEP-CTERM sorting domain-containing protein [Leptolyngbya sp. UWPOB_LEPTO1]
MRFNSVLPIAAAAVSIAMTTAVKPVSAFTVGFGNITTNNGTNSSAVSGQFTADITSIASGVQVLFKNAGLIASSIAEIYFDDQKGLLSALAPSGISPSAGVEWETGANPGSLPSQNTANPPFNTTSILSSQASGNNQTGINPGESLILRFALSGSNTFSGVQDAFGTGALRIGLHVRAIGGAGSDSYVSNPNAVPEPFTIVGSGVALGVGAMMRKKQQKKEKSIG